MQSIGAVAQSSKIAYGRIKDYVTQTLCLGSGIYTVTPPGGTALAAVSPRSELLTRLLTKIRRIAMNSQLLLSIKSEC